MEKDLSPEAFDYDISEGSNGAVTFHLKGGISAFNAPSLLKELDEYVSVHRPSSLKVDLKETTYMDDYGVLILGQLKERVREQKGDFQLENVNQDAEEILKILDFDSIGKAEPLRKKGSLNLFVLLGEETIGAFQDIKYMLTFMGDVCLSFIYILLHPGSLRADDTFLSMRRTGVEALPIVALISLLLGLIIAFMSSMQLKQFGADIYVASLVSVAMTYELGPIMTAIIVAGRSGSSFASEIGTMKVSEEVDALFTMGFDPVRFLVVPKVLAAVIVVPVLTLFSDVFAILGGLVVGITMLDLTTSAYVGQTFKALTLFDVFWGVMKSGVFAVIISWVGCLRGFQVRGGADSVGRATTSAVVSSIFLIILIDSLFAVIHIYWL